MEETAVLFDGETIPQELTNLGGEAATMSMSRIPAFAQETSVHYEKTQLSYHENYELGDTSYSSRRSFESLGQSAESDVLPGDTKYL